MPASRAARLALFAACVASAHGARRAKAKAKSAPVPLSLTAATFDDHIGASCTRHTFVEFFAPWCDDCATFSPIVHGAVAELAKQWPDLNITSVRVDGDAEPALRSRFGVLEAPGLLLIPAGESEAAKAIRYGGALDRGALQTWGRKELHQLSQAAKPSPTRSRTTPAPDEELTKEELEARREADRKAAELLAVPDPVDDDTEELELLKALERRVAEAATVDPATAPSEAATDFAAARVRAAVEIAGGAAALADAVADGKRGGSGDGDDGMPRKSVATQELESLLFGDEEEVVRTHAQIRARKQALGEAAAEARRRAAAEAGHSKEAQAAKAAGGEAARGGEDATAGRRGGGASPDPSVPGARRL